METSISLKKILVCGGVLLSLSGSMAGVAEVTMLSANADVIQDGPSDSQNQRLNVMGEAAQTLKQAPDTVTVNLHKTMFDQADADYFKDDSHKIKNDGTEKDYSGSGKLKHYDPGTMGKIEFTLYDITDFVHKKFDGGEETKEVEESYEPPALERKMSFKGKYKTDNLVAKKTKAKFSKVDFDGGYNHPGEAGKDSPNGVSDANLHGTLSEDMTSQIVADIQDKGEKSDVLNGVTKVSTKAIDSDGNISWDNVKAYDSNVSERGDHHFYVAVETKTPKGFVNEKSIPLVFEAPYTNPEGDGFLDTINLYAKNNTKKLSFNLKKYAKYNNLDKEVPLKNAKFQLYKGEPGKGEKIGSVLTANDEGIVTADNLVMGSYYFVEEDSFEAGVSDNHFGDNHLAISPIAKNDANNKLKFTIDENGATQDELSGYLVNYDKPDVFKNIINGVDGYLNDPFDRVSVALYAVPNKKDDSSHENELFTDFTNERRKRDKHKYGMRKEKTFNVGDSVNFNVKMLVPQNVMGSESKVNKNGDKVISEPYHVFFANDTPYLYSAVINGKEYSLGLKDVDDLRNLVIKSKDGTVLENGKDYVVYKADNDSFIIDYIVKGVSEDDNNMIQEAVKTGKNTSIIEALKKRTTGSVSDTVAKYQGTELDANYNQIIRDIPKELMNNKDLPGDYYLQNDVELGWNDGSGYFSNTDRVKAHSLNVKIVKVSGGYLDRTIKKIKVKIKQIESYYAAKFKVVDKKDNFQTFDLNTNDSDALVTSDLDNKDEIPRLQGAKFALYNADTKKWFNGYKSGSETQSGEPEIQWVDSIKDVTESVENNGSDSVAGGVLTTDKDGELNLKGLTAGTYKLRELKAPKGYQKTDHDVLFNVGTEVSDGVFATKVDADKDDSKHGHGNVGEMGMYNRSELPVLTVFDTPKMVLPLTGSKQLLVIMGTTLVLIGAGSYAGYKVYKKKQLANEEDNN